MFRLIIKSLVARSKSCLFFKRKLVIGYFCAIEDLLTDKLLRTLKTLARQYLVLAFNVNGAIVFGDFKG